MNTPSTPANPRAANREKAQRRQKVYSAPALEKGLDIFELLSDEPDGLSISDIAMRLDRSVGELFRMLAVLQQRGYLTNHPNTGLYALTLKMFELSHRFPPVKRLTAAAGPVMRRLAYDIEQSCHLTIYYHGKCHVVVQQDPPTERTFSVRLGAEAPLVNTCSGHILLAYADESERERMMEKIPDHHTQPVAREVRKVAEEVRRRGFERMASPQAHGVKDIGFPVFDHTGQAVAALVVPYFTYLDGSNPIGQSEAQQHLSRAAMEISRSLGYRQ